jgi:outer membrane lipoprotein-sorting protein
MSQPGTIAIPGEYTGPRRLAVPGKNFPREYAGPKRMFLTKQTRSLRWSVTMKRIYRVSAAVTLFLAALAAAAQDIVTPTDFLDRASKKFSGIRDYQAEVTITTEGEQDSMVGRLAYKSPNKVRIDFSKPREQVLDSNGETLLVYVPKYSYVLEQKLQKRSEASIALMASSRELAYLKTHYSAAYVIGPEPVPLDDGSREMVTKLKFQSLAVDGFRRLEIAFDRNLMIRRVTGSLGARTLVMDIRNVRLDQGIPDARFDYNPPASANVYRNFLFETE